MQIHGKGSELENLKLHRTKCSKLISKVIAPGLYYELKNDIKDKKFSILVDESTDVSCGKYMCVVLKYFSSSKWK